MSKCVIKVGKLYYAGTGKDGQENFVPEMRQAQVFDMQYKERTAQALAEELGGTLVPLVSRTQTTGRPGMVPKDIDAWIVEHAPYILNCTGPTLEMLKDYLAWSMSSGGTYDMSPYVKGVPCVLRASAFEAPDGYEEKFVFAFTLVAQGELTKKQRQVWESLPYGIPLIDDRRLLVSSLDGMNLPATELVKPVDYSGAIVKDTPERRALVAKYEAELRGQSVSNRGRQVGKMQLK